MMFPRLYLPGFEAMAQDGPTRREKRAIRRFRKVVRRERSFNIALLRIIDGKGSIVENLTQITGMSIDSIKGRVKRARYDYVEDESEPTILDADERRYLSRYYADSTDPRVQEFINQHNACTRVRPDWRGSHDADNRPVGKRRKARMTA